MSHTRCLRLDQLLEKKSLFLFGPRATGKTTLLKTQFSAADVQIFDLLESDLYLSFSARPALLAERIRPGVKKIIIDEVQRIPSLLNEVHRLIEAKKLRFLLTGSSARKLRRGHANLLAGRAWRADLFPLVSHEIEKFDLSRYLRFGGLPAIYDSSDPHEDLNAYAKLYLYVEIQAEGLVRNIPQFSRFLQTAALCSGQMINYAKIGRDAEISPSTIREYYSILEDTLVGFTLAPFVASHKRRAITTAKFYLFDIGVVHALRGTKNIDPKTDLYGQSFEHFMAQELRAYLSYSRQNDNLSFWRSAHGFEVDFLISEQVAIEVKATNKATQDDIKSLLALKEEKKFKKFYLVTQDKSYRSVSGIECLHWSEFLKLLWSGKII
jgi:predicted AAA+ superfamily ATPase